MKESGRANESEGRGKEKEWFVTASSGKFLRPQLHTLINVKGRESGKVVVMMEGKRSETNKIVGWR